MSTVCTTTIHNVLWTPLTRSVHGLRSFTCVYTYYRGALYKAHTLIYFRSKIGDGIGPRMINVYCEVTHGAMRAFSHSVSLVSVQYGIVLAILNYTCVIGKMKLFYLHTNTCLVRGLQTLIHCFGLFSRILKWVCLSLDFIIMSKRKSSCKLGGCTLSAKFRASEPEFRDDFFPLSHSMHKDTLKIPTKFPKGVAAGVFGVFR